MLTDKEKEFRRNGIGGSDIPVIMGLDSNRSPLSLYGSKVDSIDVKIYDDDTAARRGNFLEPFVAQLYSEKTGRKLIEVNTFKRDWRIANVDRIAIKKNQQSPNLDENKKAFFTFKEACPWADRIVEIKCPTSHTFHEWGEETGVPINPRYVYGQVPYKYVLQCVWYMHTMKIHQCDLVALLDSEIRIYPIEYNEIFASAIEEAAKIFWNHVETKNPPSADWKPASREYLIERYRGSEKEEMIPPTEESISIASSLKATKALLKMHEQQADDMQNKLCAMIGDNAGIEGICTWRKTNGRINWEEVITQLVKEGLITEERMKSLGEDHRGPSSRRFRLIGGNES